MLKSFRNQAKPMFGRKFRNAIAVPVFALTAAVFSGGCASISGSVAHTPEQAKKHAVYATPIFTVDTAGHVNGKLGDYVSTWSGYAVTLTPERGGSTYILTGKGPTATHMAADVMSTAGSGVGAFLWGLGQYKTGVAAQQGQLGTRIITNNNAENGGTIATGGSTANGGNVTAGAGSTVATNGAKPTVVAGNTVSGQSSIFGNAGDIATTTTTKTTISNTGAGAVSVGSSGATSGSYGSSQGGAGAAVNSGTNGTVEQTKPVVTPVNAAPVKTQPNIVPVSVDSSKLKKSILLKKGLGYVPAGDGAPGIQAIPNYPSFKQQFGIKPSLTAV